MNENQVLEADTAKDDYTPRVEIPRQHPRALDLWGEIKSIAYRLPV